LEITKNYFGFESKLSLLISVLIHGFAFWVFVLFEYKLITPEEPVYLEILFDEVAIKSPKEEINFGQEKTDETMSQNIYEKPYTDTLVNNDNFYDNARDTTLSEFEDSFIESSENEKRQVYLKYAKTLLDSFLITHPEYSSLILKQQAKELTGNKLSRLDLEQKIAQEIYIYLKERYPKGPERDFNKYAGPGIQIPIGDLIDLIKDLF
jgi:hypothetical protein